MREVESGGMIPLLNIFLLTSSPIENFISLKTYISQNAQKYCPIYFNYIDEVIIIKKDKGELLEKTQEAFFAYLDTLGIEHNNIGGYYFFNKK